MAIFDLLHSITSVAKARSNAWILILFKRQNVALLFFNQCVENSCPTTVAKRRALQFWSGAPLPCHSSGPFKRSKRVLNFPLWRPPGWHCPEQPLPIGLMSKHHQLFVLENAKVKRKETRDAQQIREKESTAGRLTQTESKSGKKNTIKNGMYEIHSVT